MPGFAARVAPASIFCPHKRVWTTCPQCGKDVIDSVKKSLKGTAVEEEPAPKRKKEEAPEAVEEPEAEE